MLDMDPGIRAEWVKRLRSGRYQQANGYLHVIDGGYCCLGVLCEIAVERGVIPGPQVVEADDHDVFVAEYGDFSGEDRVSYVQLPEPVVEWAGLKGRNPDSRGGPDFSGGSDPFVRYTDPRLGVVVARRAANLNDEQHFTFAQIADAIEEEVQ